MGMSRPLRLDQVFQFDCVGASLDQLPLNFDDPIAQHPDHPLPVGENCFKLRCCLRQDHSLQILILGLSIKAGFPELCFTRTYIGEYASVTFDDVAGNNIVFDSPSTDILKDDHLIGTGYRILLLAIRLREHSRLPVANQMAGKVPISSPRIILPVMIVSVWPILSTATTDSLMEMAKPPLLEAPRTAQIPPIASKGGANHVISDDLFDSK